MDNELIDNDFFSANNKKSTLPLKQWITISILWLSIVISFFIGIEINFKFYFSIILLVSISILNFIKPNLGIKSTFVILILGIFGIVKYLPFSVYFGFGINNTNLDFDILMLILGITHFVLNKELFPDMLKSKEENKNLNKEEKMINGFKNRFDKKSNSELEEIINNKLLMPQAIKAASELLIDRKAHQNN